jgi:hypothetical protein
MPRDKVSLPRPIPFASASNGKRESELDRDRAALELAGFITGMLHFDPECIGEHFREGVMRRLNQLRQVHGIDKAMFIHQAAAGIRQAAE